MWQAFWGVDNISCGFYYRELHSLQKHSLISNVENYALLIISFIRIEENFKKLVLATSEEKPLFFSDHTELPMSKLHSQKSSPSPKCLQ